MSCDDGRRTPIVESDVGPESQPREISVLVVDDKPSVAEVTAQLLEEHADTITTISETSASDGFNRLRTEEIDAIVSDYDMPGMDGLEFLKAVREDDPELPFILLTGKGSEEVASEAISAGVTDYFQKQSGLEQYELLTNRIEHAVSRTRAHRALADQEAWYRGLIEVAVDILAVFALDGTVEFLSPAVTDMLGYEPADLRGKDAFEFIHPDDHDDVREQFERLRDETCDKEMVEFRFQQADGGWRWVEARGINRLDDPVIAGLVVSIRDISDRKARERDLERYETVVDTVGDGIYTLDAEGRFTMINNYAVERTGYDRDDLLGEHVSLLLPDEDIETGSQLIVELLSDPNKGVASYEATVKAADGETFPVELRIAPVRGDDGTFQGTVGIARELSDGHDHERNG